MIDGLGSAGLALLASNAAAVKDRLDTTAEQSTSGLVSQSYAGLGALARTSLDLRPQIAHAVAYSANIDAATGRLDVTQTALKQLADIADTFNASLQKLSGVNSQEVDGVAANARSALQQVASLLNTKVGDIYVFAGQDSATPPVADAGNILTSSFFTTVGSAVSALATNGAAATAAATLAAPSPVTTSGAVPTVEAGPGERVQVGVLASANTLATSTGASTTGSYVHDLMRALATIGSLSSSQASTQAGSAYVALVADTRTSLGGAITAMATETGALGDIQSGLATRQTALSATQTALAKQVSSVEDVDAAATLTRLASLQTQLQASYQVIAAMKGLSLASVL